MAFVSCIHPHRQSRLLLSRSLSGRNTCEATNCDEQRSAEIVNKIWGQTAKGVRQKDEASPKFNEKKGFFSRSKWEGFTYLAAALFFLSFLAYVNDLNLMAVPHPIRAKNKSHGLARVFQRFARAALTYTLHHSFDCLSLLWLNLDAYHTLLWTRVRTEGKKKMQEWFTTNLPSSRIPPKISKFVNKPRINFVQRQLLIGGI